MASQPLNRLKLAIRLRALNECLEAQELLDEEERSARTQWMRSWFQRRQPVPPQIAEIEDEDPVKFSQSFRMSKAIFYELLGRIEKRIKKMDTPMRKAIPAKTRLMITLMYLSSGANFRVLETMYRISNQTVSKIVHETCQAIADDLTEEFVKVPQTNEEWLEVIDKFCTKSNYPFCLGSLDGKHVVVQNFAKTGSKFRNYKNSFSLVLFAVADADCKFMYAKIGDAGSCNDASIWNSSEFKRALDNDLLGVPPTPNGSIRYHIVRDNAFALSLTLAKPYPIGPNMSDGQRIFNYRISRARRVVEGSDI